VVGDGVPVVVSVGALVSGAFGGSLLPPHAARAATNAVRRMERCMVSPE
jgi:hypothetical protein